MEPQTSPLLCLPPELSGLVLSYLPNWDIKNLRLTSRFFRQRARLCLSRVFLSPNPRDISVFRAIANHEEVRKGIIEIIWDDAYLVTAPEKPVRSTGELNWRVEYTLTDRDKQCPSWVVEECKDNLFSLINRKEQDAEVATQASVLLSIADSWGYYQQLLRQQEEIITSEADVKTLRYGLERFPSLIRITITPAAHGWLFAPLYQTPMIRALPPGLNYPLPRGWPTRGDFDPVLEINQWVPGDDGQVDGTERMKWRGFSIVTRILAEREKKRRQQAPDPHQGGCGRLLELVIDVNQLHTGINCNVFNQPCEEYDNFVTILQQPGFSHLHLSLSVPGQEYLGWPCYRNGYLYRALCHAPDLQHMTLCSNVDRNDIMYIVPLMDQFVPLKTVFPIDQWPRLRHFGLSKFLVTRTDLISFLRALPGTLRSLELSFLLFLDEGAKYRGLLEAMRDELQWRDREEPARPVIRIGVCAMDQQRSGLGVWIEKEVAEFLYHGGPNPFPVDCPEDVEFGLGVRRDTFQPGKEWPWP